MNTYSVSYLGPFVDGQARVQATNIHTAVKKVLFPITVGRKPMAIRKGQSMTIRVERIS